MNTPPGLTEATVDARSIRRGDILHTPRGRRRVTGVNYDRMLDLRGDNVVEVHTEAEHWAIPMDTQVTVERVAQ